MNKILKNPILAFIIGVILATTVSVGATALYSSSEIGFIPTNTDWHVNNIEDAINDLYNNSGFNDLTLYQDLSESPNIRRRATITKTFEAEANTVYYIFGVYSYSTTNPGVTQKVLHMGSEYGTIASFSEGVTVLNDSYSLPLIKIKTSGAGTVTITINASTTNTSCADLLLLKVYK